MRVNELRTALDKYDSAVLKEIVVALYKTIPKNLKESNGLDELLLNFTNEEWKTTNNKATVDFGALKEEIEQFIDFADMQYYFAPNKYVRKEKRSKWRFEVKRFIKVLLTVGGENSEEAARLLADIYTMLSYACHHYIFSTEGPFSAVGYKQSELLQLVLDKIFYSGFDQKAIKTAVFLTLDSNSDRDTYHAELLFTLADILKTPETKELAILQCDAYKKSYNAYQAEKKVFKYSVKDDYRRQQHGNYAVELYVLLKFSLYEYDDGITYFWNNYVQHSMEVTLYYLLSFLDDEGMESLWIREYERAVAKRIKPRDSLQEEYRKRKASEP